MEIHLSGRVHNYPQSLSVSVWMQKLVDKFNYLSGDFKDYLYSLKEGNNLNQAVDDIGGSSPLPQICLGKFARPAAMVVSALGRDMQGRSKEAGSGVTTFVRLFCHWSAHHPPILY